MTNHAHITCFQGRECVKLEVARGATADFVGQHITVAVAVTRGLHVKLCLAAAAFEPGDFDGSDRHDLTQIQSNPLSVAARTPARGQFAVTDVAGRVVGFGCAGGDAADVDRICGDGFRCRVGWICRFGAHGRGRFCGNQV